MAKQPTRSKKAAATQAKPYVLAVRFNPEEHARLAAVEKRRGIPRSTLLKSLLKDEANRLAIP